MVMEHECCDHEANLEPRSFSAQELKSEFTCPMHPEISQLGPGLCPLCGMALEPVHLDASGDDGPDPELGDMTRRFFAALVLTLPVFISSMFSMRPGFVLLQILPAQFTVLLQLVLTTPVIFWAGWPLLARAWASFKTRNLNMFSLIGLGVLAAYFLALSLISGPRFFKS